MSSVDWVCEYYCRVVEEGEARCVLVDSLRGSKNYTETFRVFIGKPSEGLCETACLSPKKSSDGRQMCIVMPGVGELLFPLGVSKQRPRYRCLNGWAGRGGSFREYEMEYIEGSNVPVRLYWLRRN